MVCQELKQEMLEHDRCRDEMLNAMEAMENRVALLEEENIALKEEIITLKEENRKIAYFAKGLDREIENVCEYLVKQQNE